jgi:hypothetical protein
LKRIEDGIQILESPGFPGLKKAAEEVKNLYRGIK